MDEKTIQAIALRLLEAIYEKTHLSGNPVYATKLASTIGSSEAEALAGWRYLKQKDLINTYSIGDAASVNAKGIDIYENARRHPDNPTPGFGGSITYNIIHNVHGGVVAQAGAHSTQHQTINYTSNDLADLRNAIETLEQHIDELKLDAADRTEALAQAGILKAALSSAKPNPTIIREAVRSLRNVTEGVIGGLLVEGITHWQLVHDVLIRMTS